MEISSYSLARIDDLSDFWEVQGAANKSVTFSESYDDFVLSSFPSEIFSTGRVLHHLASINSSRLNFLKMSTEDIQHATIVNFLCAAPSKDKKK